MNRLQYESSPYLLQHAHNPVDWYPWGAEAFARARELQLPILVSIGYSTCHWCHVMERESFEDAAVAAYMNQHYINIKVDREERPDVDAIYMEACQILTGSGGWPLNCFLTPDLKPFYAGTYFPPRPAYNRPSWSQLLEHLAGIWEEKRAVALDQAEKLLQHIQHNEGVFINAAPMQGAISAETFGSSIFDNLKSRFDNAWGGFGGAPKFPSTMTLRWLLNWFQISRQPEALEMPRFSLKKMIDGGIYDQIGGGFARYATDREWLVPHFEKMLYDNALLVQLMAECLRHQPDADVEAALRQTLEYIAREMTSPEGGFYAAQDADSEGVEGKFYVWDKAEITAALGADADWFCDMYGVSEHGNWEEKNILHRPQSIATFAQLRGMDETLLRTRLREQGDRLLALRAQRIWPGLDHKIILGWNALMSSGYAAAFITLGKTEYRDAALRNLAFVQDTFKNADTTEAGLYRHSAAQPFAFLDDYAALATALIDAWHITFDKKHLDEAAAIVEYVLSRFSDTESGMFFFTDIQQSDVLFRKKELYDNATPAGNSMMAHSLQKLGLLLDRPEWRSRAADMLGNMQETLQRYPLSFGHWSLAALNEANGLAEIAVVGGNALEKALAIQRHALPQCVMAAAITPDEGQPLLSGKAGSDDAFIYVCRHYACQKPVYSIKEMLDLVNSV